MIDGQLARGRRPGYTGEQGQPVSIADVDAWLEEAKRAGIRSIICLLADDQLQLYEQLPGGLLSHYRAAGYDVEHVQPRMSSAWLQPSQQSSHRGEAHFRLCQACFDTGRMQDTQVSLTERSNPLGHKRGPHDEGRDLPGNP